jgi:hypothetical protein
LNHIISQEEREAFTTAEESEDAPALTAFDPALDGEIGFEDLHGRGGKLLPAMDLFSMGCVIAEMFNAGKPLFRCRAPRAAAP